MIDLTSLTADPLSRYTIEAPVEIIVGEGDEAETHYVHPSLLCEKSGYLRGRLQNESSEITTRRIRLVDVKPITFRYLLKWLYTGDIALSPELQDDCSHVPSVRLLLIDIYVLAHRMLCPELEDRSMDVIQHCCENARLNLEDLMHVVNSKARSSQMWRYSLSSFHSTRARLDGAITRVWMDGQILSHRRQVSSANYCWKPNPKQRTRVLQRRTERTRRWEGVASGMCTVKGAGARECGGRVGLSGRRLLLRESKEGAR